METFRESLPWHWTAGNWSRAWALQTIGPEPTGYTSIPDHSTHTQFPGQGTGGLMNKLAREGRRIIPA